MKFFPRVSIAALFAAVLSLQSPLALAAPPAGVHLNVASVDSKRLLEESAPAKAAFDKISNEFKPRQQALQAQSQKLKAASDQFDQNSAHMTDADRTQQQRTLSELDRAFQRDQRAFSEDFNARRSQELSGLLELMNRAIRKIADAGGYDIVVQDAYYASPRVDITEQVLKELANPTPASK